MTGEHLFLLAFFKLIWPHATREECSATIAIYSSVLTNTEVTKGYKHLDLTLKKGSTSIHAKEHVSPLLLLELRFPGGDKRCAYGAVDG